MSVGQRLLCSRHGGMVTLTAKMKHEQRRICDDCIAKYKRERESEQRGAIRAERIAAGTINRATLDGETWRDIPGHAGYQASSLGRIRSLDRFDSIGRIAVGRVLRASNNAKGYPCIGIRGASGARKTTAVHKLVALAYIGPVPAGKEVAHGDGDKANCRPSNLRYATHGENEADKAIHGTKFIAAGERNGHAKLTARQVESIRTALANGESNASLARKHGVDPSLVSHIKRGAHWRPGHGI